MKFEKISAAQLDEFVKKIDGPRTFLQGSKNGNFREKLGEQNFRVGIFDGEKLVAVSQFQKITARRGTFLHVAHGPLISCSPPVRGEPEGGFEKTLKFFLAEIKKFARAEKCDFVRISPLVEEKFGHIFCSEKFRAAPLHVNPDQTWILDLTPPEDEILKNMRKSTRYEIRRIEKVGIKIFSGNEKKDLKIFWDLHSETAARQKFTPFSKKATELELEIFGDDCQIFSAKIEEKFFASSVILFDDHAAYYHQGASIFSKLPAAHATIWAAILEAKKRGCREFNFWGVAPADNLKHPWTGLSRFKRGFGGAEEKFLPAQDFPITKKYWLNFAVEKFRKWKRNY
ncbi:peptidoglycan bridge formation glycyltransferase FemA/FemB family protein [bacterium]|jgi:peptidoglycan pentaglycine glycine transferase (the first glycine)|nr:peptidoglycan bridge formation glycyltransferase FemA/FemB family protein [bacterium]MBT6831667.1 peptidoglycan bridge formation glycyltransferase FemA/FemB family protein [bacterium]MBT6996313.1 peptidoglycan bridge formation glycyltransferase FemA/FemB family protein [bacterium]MBT7772991.1 peptidoglycan bridge formation glycyltransferase FemA/FemB family protein [bacterium]